MAEVSDRLAPPTLNVHPFILALANAHIPLTFGPWNGRWWFFYEHNANRGTGPCRHFMGFTQEGENILVMSRRLNGDKPEDWQNWGPNPSVEMFLREQAAMRMGDMLIPQYLQNLFRQYHIHFKEGW